MKRNLNIYVFYALLAISWLVSNHYSPWLAFHSDWVACSAVVISFSILLNRGNLSFPVISIFLFFVSLIPIFQYFGGLIYFKGDAIISFGYIFLASLAAILGLSYEGKKDELYDCFAIAVLSAGLISMWIALAQWLSVNSFGLFAVQVPLHGRVYANFAQPNQFATFIMVNVCSVFYIYKRGHVRIFTALFLVVFFGWGLSLAQSRSGFFELIVFCVLGLIFYWRNKNFRLFFIATLLIFLVNWVILLPLVSDFLGFPELRSDKTSLGVRHIHWQTALHAILMEPLFGYGWNQVSVALAKSVIFFPPTHEFLEHSHNFLLDILIWNGVPLSLMFFIIIFSWVYYFLFLKTDLDDKFVVLVLLCFIVHAMLEFPLEYAYFLMPFSFLLGSLEKNKKNELRFNINNILLGKILIPSVLIIGLIWFGYDYLNVEDNVRSLRLEDRGLIVDEHENTIDSIKIFDQQKNYILFARTTAQENMSDRQLDWMRKISERYGYAPALFRYAIAAGLNDRPQDAINSLQRICKTSTVDNCGESKSNWDNLRMQHKILPVYPD